MRIESLSILIPTLGLCRKDELQNLLESLGEQSQGVRSQFLQEILIVVDQKEVPVEFSSLSESCPVPLRFFSTGGRLGPSKARNLAAMQCQSDWMYFLDDDLILKKGSLLFLQNLQLSDSVIGIEGKTEVQKGQGFQHRQAASTDFEGGFGSGNIVYHRDSFLSAGGFDQNYFIRWGEYYLHFREDTDLGLRISCLGELLYCPELLAFHPVEQTHNLHQLSDAWKYFFEPYFLRQNPQGREWIGGWFTPGILGTRQTRELVSGLIIASLLAGLPVLTSTLYLLLALILFRSRVPSAKEWFHALVCLIFYPLVHTSALIAGFFYSLLRRPDLIRRGAVFG